MNLAKNGDHYGVFAHVTPTTDPAGRVVGHDSNRRTADRRAVATIQARYAEMCTAERAVEHDRSGSDTSKRRTIAASAAHLTKHLAARGQSYDEFVWSL